MEKIKRNRAATILRVVNALEQVLVEEGLQSLCVESVAKKAAVSKVLLYRYFGGLDGLLEYYIRMGRLVPQYTPLLLEQIQPAQPADLGPIWSGQALYVFQQFRSSRAAREPLKATVNETSPLSNLISSSLDAELTRLVNQLAFVEGGDHQAISAVLVGALSYLTIQAQNNRPVIGLDLRDESDWTRIEEAVKSLFKAIAQLAIDSPTTQVTYKPVRQAIQVW